MRFLTLCLITFFSLNSYALDAESSEALKKTQAMFRDRSKRMNAVNSTEKGKAAHQKVENMFGSTGNIDNAYEMAAQMMGAVINQSNGDSMTAQQMLNQGLTDPAAFAERMPTQFKQLLKQTAGDIEEMNTGPKRH